MKRLTSIVITALLLSGCSDGGVDLGPVGGGLSVIGLGIVIGCLLLSLGGKGGER